MDAARPVIDAGLVRCLVAAQFPHWAGLDIRPVESSGWDNRTFRLGPQMLARLPSAEGYVRQVEKEQVWLPRLAPHLPLPIPRPLALGAPGEGYPWPWSVYEWLEGRSAAEAQVADQRDFAVALARFLSALQRADARQGPPPGAHNHLRGAPLHVYDAQTRKALAGLAGQLDIAAAEALWNAALASQWTRAPVWFHGDVSAGNLLLDNGHLSAVIDFGLAGVGDPACDLVIAWTFLNPNARRAFRDALDLDEATWIRGRGWALWKALIVCAGFTGAARVDVDHAWQTMAAVLAD